MSAADTYVVFLLGGAAYGLRSSDVLHVEMLDHITPVPNTAPSVEGVVFSRGRVIPAINLRLRFGLPREEVTPRTRLIFLQAQGRTVALIVDAAREFQRIPDEAIRPAGESLPGIAGRFVEGHAQVRDRSVLILDVGAVLRLEEIDPPLPAGLEPSSARA
ncbi:MAG TPA: chemotaxis protein CheW [Opitutaceae bacterium]|nr:chemotaxis protein CheW [Opitutaceae bacterium]